MNVTGELDVINNSATLIINEIKKNDGKINHILNTKNIIKIMSNISNYVRCDVISKTETITYKMPASYEKEMEDFF